jgi:hypothetical protein
MPARDQFSILLGKRISDPAAEDIIDRNVKRFLSKCWNLRSKVTGSSTTSCSPLMGFYAAPVA